MLGNWQRTGVTHYGDEEVLNIHQIKAGLHESYPFKSHFLEIGDSKIHYVDEGQGEETFLLVHGNPTWSFYFRELIKHYRTKFRVVAIDHMGMGLSDRPQEYQYSLSHHISNLEKLIQTLDLKQINLVVHDWGGAIGLGAAVRHPAVFKRIFISNTAAFEDQDIPKRIAFCRQRFWGKLWTRGLNGFAYPATFMAAKKPLHKDIRRAYLLPLQDYSSRVGVYGFLRDIPMKESDHSFKELKFIEKRLRFLTCPKKILWGGKDFCFHEGFFKRWKQIYPEADAEYFPESGHFLFEDAPQECLASMDRFITETSR